MRNLLFSMIAIFILSVSCNSSERAAHERRGLMMPKKSELPRNTKKYKEREREYNKKK